MRSKKAFRNMMASMGYEVIAVVCGLVLPRLILSRFGSSYNGITSSITQFLSCVALLKAGVGGVTRAALYKPLANGDTAAISAIFNATSRFMKRTALIFILFILAFAGLYPFLVSDEFDWLFSSTLVLILGISTFAQYYFGISNQLLLEADQRQYVPSVIQVATITLNTLLSALLIHWGAGIHAVKMGSAIVFSLNPLLINLYVRRIFSIDKSVPPNGQAIKQRWDAFSQSVAYFVHNNTDIMILTCFVSIKEVSVYTVYNYVIANIRNVIMTFVTGFGAAFGNMLARNETELLKENLGIYELIVFSLTSVIYSTAGILFIPFVLIYTAGVHDVDYARPLFVLLITAAGAFSCFRIPYQTIVEAAGRFKQTRNGAFVEAGLNIGLSIIFVMKYGLVGVAIGTLAATIFRSVQYSSYLSHHIIARSPWIFWRHVALNVLIAAAAFGISYEAYTFETPDFGAWILKAILVTLTSAALTALADITFYRKDTLRLVKKTKDLLTKKRGSLKGLGQPLGGSKGIYPAGSSK